MRKTFITHMTVERKRFCWHIMAWTKRHCPKAKPSTTFAYANRNRF